MQWSCDKIFTLSGFTARPSLNDLRWCFHSQNRLCFTGFRDSKSQRLYKSKYWFKSYCNFSKFMDVAYWWSGSLIFNEKHSWGKNWLWANISAKAHLYLCSDCKNAICWAFLFYGGRNRQKMFLGIAAFCALKQVKTKKKKKISFDTYKYAVCIEGTNIFGDFVSVFTVHKL